MPEKENSFWFDYNKLTLLAAFILAVIFVCFVYFYEQWDYRRIQSHINTQAQVIAGDLWNYNHQSAAKYMRLAARSNNYGKITVREPDGQVFQAVKREKPGGTERFLRALNLISGEKITAEISYEGQEIGTVEATWYSRAVYVHIYVLVLLQMLLVAFHFYARVLHSKNTLEKKVTERTAELAEANTELRTEVSERRKTEEKFRSYINSSPHSIFILDTEGNYLEVNEAAVQNTGYSEDELLQMDIYDMLPPEFEEEVEATYAELLREGEIRTELPYITKDGEKRFGIMDAIELDEGTVLGIYTDITERREKEQALEKSLEEKKVLLREIHHRVKNNLFTIISLLEMQEMQVEDDEFERFLSQSINRIHSMALIHKEIYASEEYSELDFGSYLKKLVSELKDSMVPAEKKIEMEFRLGEHNLDLDRSIPCALAVNELVTNAFSHGFADRDTGTLKVEFRIREDNYQIKVADDGQGLPDDFLISGGDTLGLPLVSNIIKNQLQGDLAYESNDWTVFEFEFPLKSE
ncbi:MAG: sensor histidine kinase [bacterium]